MPPLRWFFLLPLACCALAAPEMPRQPVIIDENYHGAHAAAFREQLEQVRLLARQAQIEVTARLGLIQYREGFRYPLTVRFEDSAPVGIENVLAYVRLSEDDDNQFRQELVVNLSATRRRPKNFERVFYHEMTHAVLNDAIGGEASLKIPHWAQEGLAQWITDEGEDRLKKATAGRGPASVGSLLCDLEGPYSARAYSQYYLSIRYMNEAYSINAVQAFVRNLIAGQATQAALEDATGVSWDRFQTKLHDYSLRTLHKMTEP